MRKALIIENQNKNSRVRCGPATLNELTVSVFHFLPFQFSKGKLLILDTKQLNNLFSLYGFLQNGAQNLGRAKQGRANQGRENL